MQTLLADKLFFIRLLLHLAQPFKVDADVIVALALALAESQVFFHD